MKVVPDSCSLKSEPGEDGSVVVQAQFTMRPDPNMDTIIGQTAHNLDEVSQNVFNARQHRLGACDDRGCL